MQFFQFKDKFKFFKQFNFPVDDTALVAVIDKDSGKIFHIKDITYEQTPEGNTVFFEVTER